jgi:hypothetical protein
MGEFPLLHRFEFNVISYKVNRFCRERYPRAGIVAFAAWQLLVYRSRSKAEAEARLERKRKFEEGASS